MHFVKRLCLSLNFYENILRIDLRYLIYYQLENLFARFNAHIIYDKKRCRYSIDLLPSFCIFITSHYFIRFFINMLFVFYYRVQYTNFNYFKFKYLYKAFLGKCFATIVYTMFQTTFYYMKMIYYILLYENKRKAKSLP